MKTWRKGVEVMAWPGEVVAVLVLMVTVVAVVPCVCVLCWRCNPEWTCVCVLCWRWRRGRRVEAVDVAEVVEFGEANGGVRELELGY